MSKIYLGKFFIYDMLPLAEQATQLAINNIHGIWSLGTAPGHMDAVRRILISVRNGYQLQKIVSSSRYLPEDLVNECWKNLIRRCFGSRVDAEPLVPSPARTWYDVWIHYEETDKLAKEEASERLRNRMVELRRESEHEGVQVVRIGSIKAQNKTTNYAARQPWGVPSRSTKRWDEARPMYATPQTKGSKAMQKLRSEARSVQRTKEMASSRSSFRTPVSAPKVPVRSLDLPPQPYRPGSVSRPSAGDFMLPAAGSSRPSSSSSTSRPSSSGSAFRPTSGILSRRPPFNSGKRKPEESYDAPTLKKRRMESVSPSSSSTLSSMPGPSQHPSPSRPVSTVSRTASAVSSRRSLSPPTQPTQTAGSTTRPRQRPMTMREKMLANSKARELAKSQKPAPGDAA